MPTPKPARSAAPNPMPIQYTPFTLKHFQTPEGIAFVNLQMSQIVNAINRGTGQAGPVVIPAGLDVAGASVTGLGAPSDPSDAVSLSHAQGNYAAPSVGPQLDIGGSNTLKGLAYCYGQTKANNTAIAELQGALGTFEDVTGSRAFGTVYQNTNDSAMYVSAVGSFNLGVGHNASALGYIGATSSPTTLADANSCTNGPGWASASFFVPSGWYYKVLTHQGTDTDPLTLVAWGEWT